MVQPDPIGFQALGARYQVLLFSHNSPIDALSLAQGRRPDLIVFPVVF
jgi:hypothetical protein